MSGHTPGPWHVEAGNVGWMVCCHEGGYLAGLEHTAQSYEEDEANAKLIAASPALLEALVAADEALAQFTAFEDDARYIMGNTNFEIVKDRRAKVKAALALASDTQSQSEKGVGG